MNRGAVADLAAFKPAWPLWLVRRAGPDWRTFTAVRGGVMLCAATLGELAQRIGEAEAAWPS